MRENRGGARVRLVRRSAIVLASLGVMLQIAQARQSVQVPPTIKRAL